MEFMSGYQDPLMTFSTAMADWYKHYEAAWYRIEQNRELQNAAQFPLDRTCTYWILHLIESTGPPIAASTRLKQISIDPSELMNTDGQSTLLLTDSSGFLLGFDVLSLGRAGLRDREKAAGGDCEGAMDTLQRILGLLRYSMEMPMSGGMSRRPHVLRVNHKRLHRLLSSGESFLSVLNVALWPEAAGGWVPVDVDPETGTPCLKMFSMRWPPTYYCHACKKHSSLSQLKPCPGCKAVLFCSGDCSPSTNSQALLDFSRNHCCERLSICASRNAQLADLPFTYATETTTENFDVEHFLVENKLDTGYWQHWSLLVRSHRFELISEMDPPRGHWLAGHLEPYGSLKKEANILLSLKPHNCPGFKSPLVSWSQYFSWRSLNLASPVAVLLSSTLSIYYIITSLVPQDFPELNILKKQSLKIHIIESDREFHTLMTLSELSVLLPHMTFELSFIGENLPQECDEQQFFLQNKNGCVSLVSPTLGSEKKADKRSIRIKAYKRAYHKLQGPKPDLVIGFRPAMPLNDFWLRTLPRLQSLRVPAYFCELSEFSCESSQQVMTSATGGVLSTAIMNPFRCPLRTCGGDNLLPWYSNAFIFHLIYKPLAPYSQRPAPSNGQNGNPSEPRQPANQRLGAAQRVALSADTKMTRKERKWAAHNGSHKRK